MKYKIGDTIQIMITNPIFQHNTLVSKYNGRICTIEDIRQFKEDTYYKCKDVPFLLDDDFVRGVYDQF